jgi:hypothetical protein
MVVPDMVDPYMVDHLDIVVDLDYLHKEFPGRVVVLDCMTYL